VGALPLSLPVQAQIKFHGTAVRVPAQRRARCQQLLRAPEGRASSRTSIGGTIGGPMVHNHAYFFTYYEGLRDNQDITHGVVVPTVAERNWRLLGRCAHSLANATTSALRQQSIAGMINPITAKVPTVLSGFQTRWKIRTWPKPQTWKPATAATRAAQRLTGSSAALDTLTARYSYSTTNLRSPYSELGADVPGFPVGYYTPTRTWAGSLRRIPFSPQDGADCKCQLLPEPRHSG
jgi:hypothetical protein